MTATVTAFQTDAFQNDAFQVNALPYYGLEVMWDGATWTDESANQIALRWKRGRDRASQLTGRSVAGSLDAELRNPSGRYASLNASSPLYGNLIPGRKVRVRFGTTVLWQGFLDEIVPDRGGRGDIAMVTLRASGPLKKVASRDTTTTVYLSVTTGTAVGNVLDDAGWPSADRTIDGGQVTMTRWKADGVAALTALRELEETEFGYVGESKDGKIVFEDVEHRLLAPHSVSQATFSDTAAAALFYDDIQQLDPWREIFNRFTAEVTTFAVQALATLWQVSGEIPSIDPGTSRDFWAVYPGPRSPTQADHVSAWTTPVAATDVIANSASDGSGADLTGSIAISVSKFANSMKITLTNNAAVLAYLTTLQARGTPVYANDPIKLASEDATSQGKYGIRAYPLPGRFYPSTDIAQSFVSYGLARFKGPVAVLEIEYDAHVDNNHLDQAIARDVSERITVVANATNEAGAQLGISGDFYIESEEHQVNLSGHRVRYQLSDASGDGGWWTLGLSQLGISTKLSVG